MSPAARRPPRHRKRRRPDAPPPERLRAGGLAVIIAGGVLATFLGVQLVDVRFAARDLEMQTSRLQEIARIERDDASRLEAQLGALRRDERLRATAMDDFGMVEPAALVVEEIAIDAGAAEEIRRAEARAAERLAQRREAMNLLRKEVP